MNEQVILVFNADDDIVGIVRPVDELNPLATSQAIEDMGCGDLTTEVFTMTSYENYSQYLLETQQS